MATWADLPGEAASLAVTAQGYLPAQSAQTLQRGPNELPVKLERDPFGILPSQACAAGETLLYVEDFQDGKAQGWQNISAATDFAAMNGWSITPLVEGNPSLSFANLEGGGDDLQGFTFDNAVWRVKVRADGRDGSSFLNWRHAFIPGAETRYPVQWDAGVTPLAFTRLELPGAGHFIVGHTELYFEQNRWYYMEISTYQGEMQVWVDGQHYVTYVDPQLLPAGTIGLEGHINNVATTRIYFDDISVCQLNAPFTSLPLPEGN
jgi:hypothetical protein